MGDRLKQAQEAAACGEWATVVYLLQDLLAQLDCPPSNPSVQSDCLTLALHCLAEADFQTRWDIAKVIPQFGAIALPPLLDSLNTTPFDEEEWEYLWFVARLVGEFDQPDAIAALLTLLQTDHPDFVQIASDALAHRGALVVPALTAALDQPGARFGIVQTLAKIDHPSVIEPLLNAVQEPDVDIRATALHALIRFSDERIPPLMMQALSDPATPVRQAAVVGVSLHVPEPEREKAVMAIAPLLLDLNEQVGRYAAIALGRLGTSAAIEALDQAWRSPYAPSALRQEIVQVLGRMEQERAIALLDHYLQELIASTTLPATAQAHQCQEIVTILGRIESPILRPQAAKILVNVLRLSTPLAQYPPFRQAIAFSLGQLQCPDTIEALIQLLADPNTGVRLHAIAAMRQIDPVEARLRLEQIAQDETTPSLLQQGVTFALAEWSRSAPW